MAFLFWVWLLLPPIPVLADGLFMDCGIAGGSGKVVATFVSDEGATETKITLYGSNGYSHVIYDGPNYYGEIWTTGLASADYH